MLGVGTQTGATRSELSGFPKEIEIYVLEEGKDPGAEKAGLAYLWPK